MQIQTQGFVGGLYVENDLQRHQIIKLNLHAEQSS